MGSDVQPLLKWSSRLRLDDGKRGVYKPLWLLRAVNTCEQEAGLQCH